jgi:hypothetical protein
MTVLFNELLEKLKTLDEVSLLELLEISSEDLVETFKEQIEDKYEQLLQAIE